MKRVLLTDNLISLLLGVAALSSFYWLVTEGGLPAAVTFLQSVVAFLSQLTKKRIVIIFAFFVVALSVTWVFVNVKPEQITAVLSSSSTLIALGLSLRQVHSLPLHVDGPLLNKLADVVHSIWIEKRLNPELQDNGAITVFASNDTVATWKEKGLYLNYIDNPTVPSQIGPAAEIVYNTLDKRRRILVLGPQASGKTITLLQVLEKLLEQRKTAPFASVPVLFNLSSWSQDRKILKGWMVDELNKSYGISRPEAEAIVAGNKILPLLDGLDEVASSLRDECAERINEYCLSTASDEKVAQARDAVVCCREEVYRSLTDFNFLFVSKEINNSAKNVTYRNIVRLLPLDNQQITEYLVANRIDLEQIHKATQKNPIITDLLETPFLLKVVASNPSVVERLSNGNREDAITGLLDAYIEQAFKLALIK